MSRFLRTARAAATYEFRMQIRRPAVWVTLALLAPLLFTGQAVPGRADPAAPVAGVLADFAVAVSLLLTMGAGCLLANRLPRDRTTGMPPSCRRAISPAASALPSGRRRTAT